VIRRSIFTLARLSERASAALLAEAAHQLLAAGTPQLQVALPRERVAAIVAVPRLAHHHAGARRRAPLHHQRHLAFADEERAQLRDASELCAFEPRPHADLLAERQRRPLLREHPRSLEGLQSGDPHQRASLARGDHQEERRPRRPQAQHRQIGRDVDLLHRCAPEQR
jgi:hypothetical protein